MASATGVIGSPDLISRRTGSTAAYLIVVLLSAFLLFQSEFILGKYILPWYGGTTGVWATCLLFFQVCLLAGYSYAHLLSTRGSLPQQIRIHSLLLLASLILLASLALLWPTPITPGLGWKPQSSSATPVWSILRLLSVSIGLPFLLLSTTASLVQHWYAQTHDRHSPYHLYAFSNLGSLLGLIAYPLFTERWLRLPTQAWLWSLGYAIYVALIAIFAFRLRSAAGSSLQIAAQTTEEPAASRPRLTQRMVWIGLAALGSNMLLAVTHVISHNVAVIPLLWMLPLIVYLLSFVLCFHSARWYRPGLFHLLLAIATVVVVLSNRGWDVGLRGQIATYLGVLFVTCMFCHGELYQRRPQPRWLTTFYLDVALGGAVGGAFVSLVCPLIFRGYWEFYLGLVCCLAAMPFLASRNRNSWIQNASLWLPLGIMLWLFWGHTYMWQRTYPDLWLYLSHARGGAITAIALLATLLALKKIPMGRKGSFMLPGRPALVYFVLTVGIAAVTAVLFRQVTAMYRASLWAGRNFYGALYITDRSSGDPRLRAFGLINGQTIHGLQFESPDLRDYPTSYYWPGSGVGLALTHHPRALATDPSERGLRIGVIGLGIGTLASYARRGDLIRFYEINPQDIQVALGEHGHFSFLQDSRGAVQIVPGDARISMERELARGTPQAYDVLVIDAFNGDSIPVHLLTRECFALYMRDLRGPNSILAFHVTNQWIDLEPVIAGLAQQFHLHGRFVDTPAVGVQSRVRWILLSASETTLADPALTSVSRTLRLDNAIVWTDDYNNLLRVLR